MTTLAMPPNPSQAQQPDRLDLSPSQLERDERARRTTAIVDELRRAGSGPARQALVDDLIATNTPVARSMASRYRNRGIDLDDLEQVALVGLVKAARRFDPHAGHDFMSYAVPTVRGELRRHFRDSGWMIRVPRRVQQLQAGIRSTQHELESLLGRSPRPSEIARHLGVDPDEVVEALAADGCFRPASIDTSADDEHGGTIADVLGIEERGFESLEAKLLLDSAMGRLTQRERQILKWRFIDERTQREIAELVGLTQAQVSRILTRVLTRLRADLSEPLSAA